MSPGTGLLLSGPRYNGLVLPGDGFKGDAANSPLASDPAVLALFRGAPRGFSETHANAFEPRLGMSYRSTRPPSCGPALASSTTAPR